MDYIEVPNTAQLELVYNWGGQQCQNVLHYLKATPWTAAQLEELAEEAADLWTVQFPGVMPTTLSLIEVVATDLSDQFGPSITHGTGLPVAGTNASPSLPNNVALVVTKRTASRGRSFRGRIYHPGLVESQVVGNTVNPSDVTAILGRWGWFQLINLPVAVDEGIMVVVSRHFEGQPRTTGVTTIVTSLTSDGTVDSQRRRLPGRGA
jgi:hypothetical protein